MSEIRFKAPWESIEESALVHGINAELEKEIGPKHPLWKRCEKIIGRSLATDDIALELSDGGYAVVHLVWHGKIDQYPERYPSAQVFKSNAELQLWLETEFFHEE